MNSFTCCERAPETGDTLSSPAAAATDEEISAVFHRRFFESEATLLCGGATEPLYEPWIAKPPAREPARIHYREDFAASALHEVAHWCIAGARRRELVDYGYWYAPDGRDGDLQREFMRVEARPQALEWCFSHACRLPFRLSFDNLDSPPSASEFRAFAEAVLQAARAFARGEMPPRAERFFDALCGAFQPGLRRDGLRFELGELLP